MSTRTRTRTLDTEARRRYAVARAGEVRREALAPIRSEVAAAIAEVGWRKAKPVVVAVMAPVGVTGRHGTWWHYVTKRRATRLLAGLHAIPRQGRLFGERTLQPPRSLDTEEVAP